MITEHDLQEAIAECQGERNPNAQTCIKLAAFYTIRDHLYPEPQQDQIEPRTYSYTAAPDSTGDTIFYSSGRIRESSGRTLRTRNMAPYRRARGSGPDFEPATL